MVGLHIDDSSKHPEAHRRVGSFIGRMLLSRHPPLKNGYCNLGCGSNYEEGYCNADFFPFNGLRRLLRRPRKRLDWAVDLRYPLKCRDGYFKGVFFEHTFEHLDVWDGQKLLSELHRILRAGGTLRVTVPSLKKYIDYYIGAASHPGFDHWKIRSEALWSLTQNWGHKAVYDADLLGKLLTDAGFVNVEQCSFRQGRDKALLLDSKSRDWETLYVEATRG